MDKKCDNGKMDHACLAVMRQAFQSAGRKEINPSELARTLRELLADCGPSPRRELCREIKEFVDLDLSDYAYSLAIHDQPAIEKLDRDIKDWAQRLDQAAEQAGD